jgi:hypothetical protein
MAALEHDGRLDAAAGRLEPPASRALSGRAGDVLRGEWLGHALHPLLTDFPLGCWIGAGLLDLVGGRRSRPAAQRLVGIGLLAVPGTAAAGLADWSATPDPRVRRVGLVHATANVVGAGCYLRSWSSRRAGRHARGVAWGLAGGTVGWVSGYLGGHLSFVLGAGHGPRGGLWNRESARPAAATPWSEPLVGDHGRSR